MQAAHRLWDPSIPDKLLAAIQSAHVLRNTASIHKANALAAQLVDAMESGLQGQSTQASPYRLEIGYPVGVVSPPLVSSSSSSSPPGDEIDLSASCTLKGALRGVLVEHYMRYSLLDKLRVFGSVETKSWVQIMVNYLREWKLLTSTVIAGGRVVPEADLVTLIR